MYGHVITKFSGMGRFTYPWCSAGALGAPDLRYYIITLIPYENLSLLSMLVLHSGVAYFRFKGFSRVHIS